MAESSTISGSGSVPAPRAREAFRAARDVSARAAVTRTGDSGIEAAFERLRRLLESGPLDTDVPRGYYLNILV